ncbi:helix-turn-helix domain-containing protein [Methylotenera sp.]|uniref:helix-turn-helix domain-containing protein n=1 Tax=Methylotenera sp. TaxID=2051956 RepID=UPI002734898C|nr:helix-turn-helix transcriptional regulator [Methylotenera sp.]MDP3005305.1 helix-turn-helix transcriptional regulator [Methylotenera sp.]
MSVFSRRLREARIKSGYSQEKLGLEAELDPMSASTRMNRYELAKRTPDFSLVEKFAEVLKVPPPYFFAKDDDMADLILSFSKLRAQQKSELLKVLEELLKI